MKTAFYGELDAIPVSKLLGNSPLEDIYSCKTKKELMRFFRDRPYYFMLSYNERDFIATTLALYLFNQQIIFSIDDWENSITYIHYKNGRKFNLDEAHAIAGQSLLEKYQALYLTQRLEGTEFYQILQEFLKIDVYLKRQQNFWDFLRDKLSEDIHEKFLDQKEPRIIDLSEFQACLTSGRPLNKTLFYYPEFVKFSAEAHERMVEEIRHRGDSNYTLTEVDTAYYLATYTEADDCASIYPVLKGILKTTNNYNLFRNATSILLDCLWGNLPDNLNDWFTQEIYGIYWSRIENVWAIEHCNEIYFRDEEQQHIFDDSLNWIMCLENIAELNPEIGDYLARLTKKDFKTVYEEQPSSIWKRVFEIISRKKCKDINKLIEYALSTLDTADAWYFLAFPDDQESAKAILDKLFSDDISEEDFLYAFELLLLSCNNVQARTCILKYFIDNFDSCVARLSDQTEVVSLFTASCSGTVSSSELESLRRLLAKCKNILENAGVDECHLKVSSLEQAIRLAEERARVKKMQRNVLRKSFKSYDKEFAKKLAIIDER